MYIQRLSWLFYWYSYVYIYSCSRLWSVPLAATAALSSEIFGRPPVPQSVFPVSPVFPLLIPTAFAFPAFFATFAAARSAPASVVVDVDHMNTWQTVWYRGWIQRMDVSVDNRFALQEIFVYRRFKSIMFTFLVKNLKHTWHVILFAFAKYNIVLETLQRNIFLFNEFIWFNDYFPKIHTICVLEVGTFYLILKFVFIQNVWWSLNLCSCADNRLSALKKTERRIFQMQIYGEMYTSVNIKLLLVFFFF